MCRGSRFVEIGSCILWKVLELIVPVSVCVCLLLQLCKCPVRESVTENLLAVLATIPRVMATTNCVHCSKRSACGCCACIQLRKRLIDSPNRRRVGWGHLLPGSSSMTFITRPHTFSDPHCADKPLSWLAFVWPSATLKKATLFRVGGTCMLSEWCEVGDGGRWMCGGWVFVPTRA